MLRDTPILDNETTGQKWNRCERELTYDISLSRLTRLEHKSVLQRIFYPDPELSNLKTITAQHIGPLLKKPLELAVAIYSGRCDSEALSLVLCWASTDGHVELAGAAIEMGADVNRCWGSFRAPLFSACYHKHEQIVRLLVSAGADINVVDSSGIPPIVATAFDTGDEVRSLAMLGINAPPMATMDRIESLVMLLLSSGASVPSMTFNQEQKGWEAALVLVSDIASRYQRSSSSE